MPLLTSGLVLGALGSVGDLWRKTGWPFLFYCMILLGVSLVKEHGPTNVLTAILAYVSYGMSPLGLRIKELRTAKGWSQRQLAQIAEVRQATVSHLESGNVQTVDLSVLERLAKALKVDAGYLIVKKRK